MNSLARLFSFYNKYVFTTMTTGGLLGSAIGTGIMVNDEYSSRNSIYDIISSGILGGTMGCSIGVVSGFLWPLAIINVPVGVATFYYNKNSQNK